MFIFTFKLHFFNIYNHIKKKSEKSFIKICSCYLSALFFILYIIIIGYFTYDHIMITNTRNLILMQSFLLWKWLISLMLSHLTGDKYVKFLDISIWIIITVAFFIFIEINDITIMIYFIISFLYYTLYALFILNQLKSLLNVSIFTIPYKKQA